MKRTTLYQVLAGSQAHGTARPDSDVDWRTVYYLTTAELVGLPVRDRPRFSDAVTGHAGDIGWEVEQAFELAARGHPSALELAHWPSSKLTENCSEDVEGFRRILRGLPGAAVTVESHLGYAKNCLTKLVAERRPEQEPKLRATYLRALYVVREYVCTGRYPAEVPPALSYIEWGAHVRNALNGAGYLTTGWVVDEGRRIEAQIAAALPTSPVKDPTHTMAQANEWLLNFRREHWDD